ncbi:MAG: insulinase family protein [Candidatus Hydrogenedentes bacterium]|nr:insulinase family protein [Candidatus Hydrogenedentota bacterium]
MLTAMQGRFVLACLASVLALGCGAPKTLAPPAPWTLSNGIRVVLVPIPESQNVSVFTYVPMGLASDPAGKTQWAHLVEHLVIRSTHPEPTQDVNAETLPDHMRLDFYGNVGNWKEDLAHHATWLSHGDFDEATLQREIPPVLSECDFTAQNLATHKFAMAAWGQAARHGKDRAEVRGDIERATLDAVRQHYQQHFAVLNRTVVCIVGGVTLDEAHAAADEILSGIKSEAVSPAATAIANGAREITWDLPTRHIVLSWPLPEAGDKDYAALFAAAAQLQMQVSQDVELQKLTGNVFVGADLEIPEGRCFFINAVLQPGAEFKQVQDALETRLLAMQDESAASQTPMIGAQLAFQLTQVMDPALVPRQAPPEMTSAMIEGNIGLYWGMNEFRFGPNRGALAKNLAALTQEDVQGAFKRHLTSEEQLVVTIRPE